MEFIAEIDKETELADRVFITKVAWHYSYADAIFFESRARLPNIPNCCDFTWHSKHQLIENQATLFLIDLSNYANR